MKFLILRINDMFWQGMKDVAYMFSQLEMYLLCFLDASTSFPWIEIYMTIIWALFACWAFQWYIWYPIRMRK